MFAEKEFIHVLKYYIEMKENVTLMENPHIMQKQTNYIVCAYLD